jgi:hypothetical protein
MRFHYLASQKPYRHLGVDPEHCVSIVQAVQVVTVEPLWLS